MVILVILGIFLRLVYLIYRLSFRWKRNHRNSLSNAQYKSNMDQSGLANGSKRASVHLTNANNNSTFGSYAPVKSIHSTGNGSAANGKAVIQMPYYDNDSSTEDEALFRKPYTDEVQ